MENIELYSGTGVPRLSTEKHGRPQAPGPLCPPGRQWKKMGAHNDTKAAGGGLDPGMRALEDCSPSAHQLGWPPTLNHH